jgi:hypothetical protein
VIRVTDVCVRKSLTYCRNSVIKLWDSDRDRLPARAIEEHFRKLDVTN